MKLTSVLLATAAVLSAQSITPAPGASPGGNQFMTQIAYRVNEESRPAYETWMKDKYRRLVEALFKEEPELRTVILTRTVFSERLENGPNYYLSYMTSGIPKSRTGLQDKVSRQLFGKSFAELQQEVIPMRKRLAYTLQRLMASTPAAGGRAEEGDFLATDCKKITPGRTGDYVQLERDYQPLRAAQVNAGRLKSWAMWVQTLPNGTDRACDAFTTHIAKDLEQAVTWNQGSAALAGQLTPPINLAGLATRTVDVAKTVRSEGRVVVMVVRRPQP